MWRGRQFPGLGRRFYLRIKATTKRQTYEWPLRWCGDLLGSCSSLSLFQTSKTQPTSTYQTVRSGRWSAHRIALPSGQAVCCSNTHTHTHAHTLWAVFLVSLYHKPYKFKETLCDDWRDQIQTFSLPLRVLKVWCHCLRLWFKSMHLFPGVEVNPSALC